MKLWNAKRIFSTGLSMVICAFLLWTLVDVLSQEGVKPVTVFIMLIFCAGCYGVMIVGLGEAAVRAEMAKKSQIPQTWSRSINTEPGCIICGDPVFLHCNSHNADLCWPCGHRHNQNNPDCVLIPCGTPELVK